jgi:hypothetical protein
MNDAYTCTAKGLKNRVVAIDTIRLRDLQRFGCSARVSNTPFLPLQRNPNDSCTRSMVRLRHAATIVLLWAALVLV